MKILIINPNSSQEMTDNIQAGALNFAKSDFEVVTMPIVSAPPFIDTYEDKALIALDMLNLVRTYENDYDAFIVACHCDPNLDLLKECSSKPVIGIGEASIKIASMIGHKFSVVSTAMHSVPNKEDLINHYGLSGSLASIRVPYSSADLLSPLELYLEAATLAVEEDHAEVIVLGCAGMVGLDKSISKQLGVPVLDGIICALIIATGMVKAGITTSKYCKYNATLA